MNAISFSYWECPKAELKEVKGWKRDNSPKTSGTVTIFLCAKAVISSNEKQ